jgi:DNA-binding CsgD family transcriptional regulator
MGVAGATRERVRGDIIRLVHRDVGLPELAQEVSRVLRRAVPFEGTCLLTVDPATLLPTGEVVENGLPMTARVRLSEIELGEPDFNKFATLARAEVPAASLSGATEGVLDRSVRQRDVRRPNGFADELRSVLAGPTGAWGALTLLREWGGPDFTPAEVRFVASLTAPLADGVRRAALHDEVAADGASCGTGLLVIGADDTVELTNDAAEQWIAELAGADRPWGPLPVAVRAVVAQTRRAADGGDAVASVRVLTRSGRWAMVRGSLVGADRVAVLFEEARPAELASAIADAYGFTDRERAVTSLVARGLSTAEIGDRLHLSAYTVQDHLKAIFEKSGTGSRGALVARLFFDHHLPRLTDAPADAHDPEVVG